MAVACCSLQDVGDVPARCHNVAHNVGAFFTRSVAIIVAVNGALLRNGQRRWVSPQLQPRPAHTPAVDVDLYIGQAQPVPGS